MPQYSVGLALKFALLGKNHNVGGFLQSSRQGPAEFGPVLEPRPHVLWISSPNLPSHPSSPVHSCAWQPPQTVDFVVRLDRGIAITKLQGQRMEVGGFSGCPPPHQGPASWCPAPCPGGFGDLRGDPTTPLFFWGAAGIYGLRPRCFAGAAGPEQGFSFKPRGVPHVSPRWFGALGSRFTTGSLLLSGCTHGFSSADVNPRLKSQK